MWVSIVNLKPTINTLQLSSLRRLHANKFVSYFGSGRVQNLNTNIIPFEFYYSNQRHNRIGLLEGLKTLYCGKIKDKEYRLIKSMRSFVGGRLGQEQEAI